MREIKFRAWDKKYKRMDYIKSMYWFEEGGIHEIKNDKEYDFMQYTGLKDKNGKEIYEGDIVKSFFVDEDKKGNKVYKYYILEIKYDELICCYNIDAFENLEVIGNIYENKNLLEVNNAK